MTSTNPKKWFETYNGTPRSDQATPNLGKSYVSDLACCCDSLPIAIDNTATVAGKTCGVCETYVPYARKNEQNYFV